jgi:hypothetical protein
VFIAAAIKYLFPVLGFLIVDEFVNNIIFWTVFFLIISLVYYYSGILGFDILETWTFFDKSVSKDNAEKELQKDIISKELDIDKGDFKSKGKIIREALKNEENIYDKINSNNNNIKCNFICINNNDNAYALTHKLNNDYDIISPERSKFVESDLKNNLYSDKFFENAKTRYKSAGTLSLRKSKSASPNNNVINHTTYIIKYSQIFFY